ncbi:unnamed protein product [Periconia digitata]|uniref:Uncharacterized protein n=1 Tax=Periconia digitata TaxID=1303443 RepID=A0A9W4UQN0_9PLEO|nr:unnamed protein product [Periconia digitata]
MLRFGTVHTHPHHARIISATRVLNIPIRPHQRPLWAKSHTIIINRHGSANTHPLMYDPQSHLRI